MPQILTPLVLPTHAPGNPTSPNQGPPGPVGPSGDPGPIGPEGPAGSDGSGSNVFVFRPSDPSPTANVFLTFQEAYDKAISTGVPATIQFDDSIDNCHIEAGTYDTSKLTFKGGFIADNQAVVFIEDGAIFNSIYGITDNIVLLYDSASAPLITAADNSEQELYLDHNSAFTIINTAPFYALTTNVFFQVHMGEKTQIEPTGSSPIFTLGDNCEIDFIYEGTDISLSADTFNGTGTSSSSIVALVNNPAASSVPLVLNGFGGNYDYNNLAQTLFIKPLVGATADRPTAPFVQEGMMFYDEQIGFPVWWNGSVWKEASRPYLPEYVMITIDSPQTTGLVTGGHVNFNTPLVATGSTTYGGYSSPGTLFVNFNDSTQGPNYTNVSHKLVGNLGDFDGTIIYQWWDKTNDVGLGNVAGNAGNAKCSDAVAIIPLDYMHNQSIAIFIELRLLFVSGTTAIGENSAGGFILPWATLESIGTPVLT